jgi:hypothetical protein
MQIMTDNALVIPRGAHPSIRSILANTTFVLSVFCYLKVVPIQAEIQPFSAIPALALIVLYSNPLKKVFLYYGFGITICLLVSLWLTALQETYSVRASFESFAAVTAPVAIFVAMVGNARFISAKVYFITLAVWVFVGFSQAFAPQLQSAVGLDALLTSLISRYSAVSLRDWGRGATLLAPEPSYSAHSIFLFLAVALYLARTGRLTGLALALSSAAIAFLVVVNQSATVIIIVALYVVMLWPLRAMICIGAVAIAIGSTVRLQELRFVEVAATGYELVRAEGISDPIAFTNYFGSMRTISVAVGYGAMLSGRFLGGGFGSWTVEFIKELRNVGIEPHEVKFFTEAIGEVIEMKPYSHVSMMAFELGFVGLILELGLIAAALRRASRVRPWNNRFALATAAVATLFIALANPVSAPECWVALALAVSMQIDPIGRDGDGARG